MMDWLEDVAWSDRSIDHIALHGVEPHEVNQVVRNRPFITRGRNQTYRVIGQTDGGRYLTVIVAPTPEQRCYVVTARDADAEERRRFRRR